MLNDSVLQSALQLPAEDRLTLVAQLLNTLPEGATSDPADDAEWAAELDRRLADDAGSVPWSKLRAE